MNDEEIKRLIRKLRRERRVAKMLSPLFVVLCLAGLVGGCYFLWQTWHLMEAFSGSRDLAVVDSILFTCSAVRAACCFWLAIFLFSYLGSQKRIELLIELSQRVVVTDK